MAGQENAVAEEEVTTPLNGQQPQGDGHDDDDGDDADFAAGLGGAPTETPEPKPEPGEVKAEPADAASEPTPAPKFVQITEDQFNDLVTKANKIDTLQQLPQRLDQAFGKIGGVERILNDLKAQPQGQPLQLSAEDFAELKSEYPELAELQMKGMERLVSRFRVPAVDAQMIDKIVGEKTTGARTEVIDATLDTVIDGDWRAEVRTPEYKQWFDEQPDDVKSLGESMHLRDAARLMRMYKVHRDAPKTKTSEAPKTPQAPHPTKRAIAAAVQPKGSGTAPVRPTADDDFQAGLHYQHTG